MSWWVIARCLAGVARLTNAAQIVGVEVKGGSSRQVGSFDDVVDLCGPDGAACVLQLAGVLVPL